MTIEETRRCNILNFQLVAEYYGIQSAQLIEYYHELLEDKQFLSGINDQIRTARNSFNFTKGLFHQERLASVDWFAYQRILLYTLIRLRQPSVCFETGVLYGGNTAFILNALYKNGGGRLISIDLPAAQIPQKPDLVRHSRVGDSELLPEGLKAGFIIPEYLKAAWEFIEGNSLDILAKLNGSYSFFCHDSEHSRAFVLQELGRAIKGLEPGGTILADDIDWSNGFMEFCVINKLYPLFLTDNGKDGLRVRTGIVRLDHPFNNKTETTGI
jgi:predicted O-methyltransferase YrrM